ncbi:hypothetical protein JDV02_005447 [Purpureocillium takamizusanense]|uniref:DSBA-like thioredoxin domain-containing protein n=1 Tax=Purpureocillium takamizusanense TaxID=2060973 RepID=A0A9Q8VBS4_9HYPO|nr:uncharacterized protein JDV02_005447 [Purpureocillium takamizusanense]UNI19251.1 hypothetical protein JDV02_005447 [Purpureocillium takamizusanense]
MGGKIDCYIDISSFYSYLAFFYLVSNLETLRGHGVEVEFHPVFAGVVQSNADNTPPWAVSKQKRDYLADYETGRAKAAFGKPEIVLPEDLRELLELGWTQKACRALLYIKDHHPRHAYHTTWHYLFHSFWTATPRRNLRDEAVLAEVLAQVPADFAGASTITTIGQHCRDDAPSSSSSPSSSVSSTSITTAADAATTLFTPDDVAAIMANQRSDTYKTMLKHASQAVNAAGAFGVPWMIVRNDKNENKAARSEPFFGSDRFHQIFQFLDLPVRSFELLPSRDGPRGGKDGAKL